MEDAIIDVENIHRRLQQHQAKLYFRSVFRIIRAAALEVRSTVVYAAFRGGCRVYPRPGTLRSQGRLFCPLDLTCLLAILSSLLVPLTVTSALCILLLPRKIGSEVEPRPITWLKSRYMLVLAFTLARRGILIEGAVILCVAAAVILPFLGGRLSAGSS